MCQKLRNNIQAKLLLLLATLALSGGCRASFPGASFGKQVEELKWSTQAVVGTPKDWRQDLEGLTWTMECFVDPEWDQVWQSITLLGW